MGLWFEARLAYGIIVERRDWETEENSLKQFPGVGYARFSDNTDILCTEYHSATIDNPTTLPTFDLPAGTDEHIMAAAKHVGIENPSKPAWILYADLS